mgnify:CR=1 FL=1|tara:strand:+ start:175 stop:606 length:432 start_codon:yes stop_codon:yes gene_type:complete
MTDYSDIISIVEPQSWVSSSVFKTNYKVQGETVQLTAPTKTRFYKDINQTISTGFYGTEPETWGQRESFKKCYLKRYNHNTGVNKWFSVKLLTDEHNSSKMEFKNINLSVDELRDIEQDVLIDDILMVILYIKFQTNPPSWGS